MRQGHQLHQLPSDEVVEEADWMSWCSKIPVATLTFRLSTSESGTELDWLLISAAVGPPPTLMRPVQALLTVVRSP